MKQYKTIDGQDGFLFIRVRNTMLDSAEFSQPTMYSGCDAHGNSRLLPDADSVFQTARVQGCRRLFADELTFAITH